MAKLAQSLPLRLLLLVGGEKGGVGKSMFSKTLCQYLLDQQQAFTLIECDRSNPDSLRSYGKGKTSIDSCVAVLSEGDQYEDAGNVLFNSALEQLTVANLPAQVFNALKLWFMQNEIFELAAESKIPIYHIYVSDCGFDSLSLFSRYVKTFGDHLHHVFVKNLGMTDDWSPFEDDEDIQALIKQYEIPVISLPKFVGNKDRNLIDKLSLTFGEAREYAEFGPISKQRVKTYLRKACADLDHLTFLKPAAYEHQIVPFERPSKGGKA